MGLIDDYKANRSLGRLKEEQIYEIVHHEMAAGERRSGLWAKAISQSDGNEQKAISIYVKLRYQSILDEIVVINDRQKESQAKVETNRKQISELPKVNDGAFSAKLSAKESDTFVFVGIVAIALLVGCILFLPF